MVWTKNYENKSQKFCLLFGYKRMLKYKKNHFLPTLELVARK